MGCLHGGKYLCKNLGVEEGGEGVCSKGGLFSGAYGTMNSTEHLYITSSHTAVTTLQGQRSRFDYSGHGWTNS